MSLQIGNATFNKGSIVVLSLQIGNATFNKGSFVVLSLQIGNATFNKGSIMNAGFLEVFTHTDAQCFVFHDVDLLAEDDRNMYSCPSRPRHLSVGVDTLQVLLVESSMNVKSRLNFFGGTNKNNNWLFRASSL